MTARPQSRPFLASASRSRILTLLTAVAGATLLPGCAWTLISTADAIGSITQAGFSVASQYSSPTFITGAPLPVNNVCIELNNSVALEDLVPAMRVALARMKVDSMVYNVGTSPPDCESRLTYRASLDWGHRQFSDEYTRYLSSIDLRLIRGNQVVVAHYQTEGLAVDRFSATSSKMNSLLRRMIVLPSDRLASAPSVMIAAQPMYPAPAMTSGYVSPDVIPIQDSGAQSRLLPATNAMPVTGSNPTR